MKRIIFSLFAILAFYTGRTNNLALSNLSLIDASHIQFDISWDNSWYTSTNYDAVWIFIKAQDCNGTSTWDHVNLSTTPSDHTVAGGTGLYVEVAATDGKGVFIRRNSNGFGTQSGTITLKFASAMADFAIINYHVNGIEMVWVPTATFSVGDGSPNHTAGSSSAYNFGTSNTTAPYSISSESAISAGAMRNTKGVSNCSTPNNYDVAYNGYLGASFPKGYAGFYSMKYEISQQQYVNFLNDLTTVQQSSRTAAPPTSAVGTFAMTNTSSPTNRNSIVVKTSATGSSPAVYDCDLNDNAVYGDGADLACNYMSWDDIMAYLDWSALRPMTELEYEKACRGPNAPTLKEYPWGSIVLTVATSSALSNAGATNETSTTSGNGLSAIGGSGSDGPLRCGFAATSSSGRTDAGAGYYGIFDMGGNVWEQTINCGWQWYTVACAGTPTSYPTGGIIFTGALGDGALDVSGNCDALNWGNSRYSILKGGAWNTANSAAGLQQVQISDRTQIFNLGDYLNNTRNSATGGRGVRKP